MIPCPFCAGGSRNLETRTIQDGARAYTRRRKECTACARRFTTTESVSEERGTSDVMIVKTKTMHELLRAIATAFSPGSGGRAAELVDALINGHDRSKD